MKKMEYIGSGKWGNVYKGCLNNVCRYKYARKNSKNNLSYEYRLMEVAYNIQPRGVVKPYYFKKHDDKDVLYMEYISLDNKKKNITMKNLKKLIKHVLTTLINIQKVYPSFRHNDLHWQNVFNTKEHKTVYIGDFGFAYIDRPGLRNPIVERNGFKFDWGIYPNNNKNYDAQLFLNSIYKKGTDEVRNFIKKLVPEDYLGSENEKLKNSRMRYNVNHSKFPSMKKIISRLNNIDNVKRSTS